MRKYQLYLFTCEFHTDDTDLYIILAQYLETILMWPFSRQKSALCVLTLKINIKFCISPQSLGKHMRFSCKHTLIFTVSGTQAICSWNLIVFNIKALPSIFKNTVSFCFPAPWWTCKAATDFLPFYTSEDSFSCVWISHSNYVKRIF